MNTASNRARVAMTGARPSSTSWRMLLGAAALVVAAVSAQQPAGATVMTTGCADTNVSCTLSELLGGGTIQVDDKLFANWQGGAATVLNNFNFASSRIVVSGAGEGTSAPGLTYTNLGRLDIQFGAGTLTVIGWQLNEFATGGGLAGPSSLSHQFSYDVVVQGTDLIEDNTLDMVLAAFVDPGFGASATVGETVSNLTQTTVLGTKTVTDASLSDSAVFPPGQPGVHVDTTINLAITTSFNGAIPLNGGPIVKIGTLTQRFSQVAGVPGGGTPLPEPGALALLSFGLAGLGFLRRRRAR